MRIKYINYNIFGNKMDTSITFIIPSINRPTLERSLSSLKNQTNPNWNAIVVFDGVTPTLENTDNRIQFITIDKRGNGWSGYVRNEGIKHVKTKWIGFLDDDDTLTSDYVEKFHSELEKQPDVIIFKMKYTDGLVLPPSHHSTFEVNHVGISFCLKTSIFQTEGIQFNQCGVEDFDLLNRLRQHNKNIVISDHITYLVKP